MKFWLSVLILGIVVLVSVYVVAAVAKLVRRGEEARSDRKFKQDLRETGMSDEDIHDTMEGLKRLRKEGEEEWPER